MMKKALILLALVANSAMALEDVYEPFNTNTNMTNSTTITWVSVERDKLQARCNAESRKRGMGGFTTYVEACSFWDSDRNGRSICTIVTYKTTNMHTLGHEVRHCFQGAWHQ